MNTSHPLQHLETRLLSMLKPGDMLRFVFSNNKNGRISVSLEGSGDDPTRLTQRISTILNAAKESGYVFDLSPDFESANNCSDDQPSIEIIPDSHALDTPPQEALGFTQGKDLPHTFPDPSLIVPNFPFDDDTPQFDYPIKLMNQDSLLARIEVEFKCIPLTDKVKPILMQALDQQVSLRKQVYGGETSPNPICAFLALWISRRIGWNVTLRAIPKTSTPPQSGLLEVIGREFFGAECSLHATAKLDHSQSEIEATDLHQAYPSGWKFPPIIPEQSASGILHAKRHHNVDLHDLPESGTIIGVSDKKKIRLPNFTREQHVYIVGGTGTGKTTLLQRMIRADLKRKESLILLDPHGDLYQDILKIIPNKRKADVITVDPTADSNPLGMNILNLVRDEFLPRRSELLVGELIRLFLSIWRMPDSQGPIFELYFRNALKLLIHQKFQIFTIMDFQRVFTEKSFRNDLLSECTDPSVKSFWTGMAEQTGGDFSLSNVAPYITSKMSPLIQSGTLSKMLSQPQDDLQLEKQMNQGKIILVNLNKGLMGANESRLLGVMLTQQIFAAGLQRSLIPVKERIPVNIYIDEFQNFVSDNVASMLSEARKFGLRMNLANQTLSQLRANRSDQDLLEAVLGNVGNMAVFRVGVPDAERLEPFLRPFTPDQIQKLPNYQALVRIMTKEGPVGPLIMETIK